MRRFLIPLSFLLITIPTLLPFFNTKFFYTQDYIFIARLQQMSTALASGQFPVRWAPDLRFGEPLYNFYAPLPYYLGAIINFFGFNYIWTAKILFILSSILSSITMYIFCNKFSSKKASMFAAILYIYAPYRAVDIYVRGAFNEVWAFVFFPLIFYTSLLMSEKKSFRNIIFLAFSLAGLSLTHNVTTLMFLPFLALWWGYLILKEKDWKIILPFIGSVFISVGLSAFFLLPAFFEKQFIQTKYLVVGYFNFRAHFVAFKQFFSTFWGYGSSLWGLDDGLSFQVGIIHVIVLILALVTGLISWKNRKVFTLLVFLGVSFLLSLFLQHNKSTFIWEAIPIMAFIQFPWRFLAISIFLVAITGAVLADQLKNRFKIVIFVLTAAVVVFNIQYFKPKEYVDDSFFDKFQKVEIMHQGIDLTKDYLPIWMEKTNTEYFDKPRVEAGDINISDFKRKSTSLSALITISSNSAVEAPIAYFPGWQVLANDRLITLINPSKNGLIKFELPKGDYRLKIEFKDTPVRILGNILSLITFVLLIGFGFKKYIFR